MLSPYCFHTHSVWSAKKPQTVRAQHNATEIGYKHKNLKIDKKSVNKNQFFCLLTTEKFLYFKMQHKKTTLSRLAPFVGNTLDNCIIESGESD